VATKLEKVKERASSMAAQLKDQEEKGRTL